MDLILIGKFETVSGAEAAIERMKDLEVLAESMRDEEDDWGRQEEHMPMKLIDELNRLKQYNMGRNDVDIFAYEHSVERKGTSVHIWTDESEIQGFLKVLINLGARVDVFSRHDWNEDGTPRAEAKS